MRGALIAVCLVALLPGVARAQAAPQTDPAAAEAIFRKARELHDAGKASEACPLYDESYRLDPTPGALLNIAECNRVAGKSATAWGQFVEAERAFRRKGDERRAGFAAEQAGAIEPSLAYVIVRAEQPPADLIVTRDGAPMTAASFGTKLPMDPGEHTVVVEAPGRKKTTLVFSAEPRRTKEWVIPPLEIQIAAEGTPGPRIVPSGEANHPRDGRPQLAAGIAVGATGVAALTVGAIFVGLTAARSADLEDMCPEQLCSTEDAKDALAEAELFANVANGMLIAGAAVAVTGLVVALTAPGDPAPSSSAVELHLAPSGLWVRGAY